MNDLAVLATGLYEDESHHPFFWAGGPAAALFIHGFPGTPAEIRSLAGALHEAGWTVQGLLLPGFGPDIESLFTKSYADWLAAAENALVRLQEKYAPVILVGYSMGGAIAIRTAAGRSPDGLILLAPFSRLGAWWHRLIWQIVRRLFPQMQPFRRANFAAPRLRQAMAGLFPELNLDDLTVQQALRRLRIPAALFDQLLIAGRRAQQTAGQVTAPTLVIQGRSDPAVRPAFTHQLVDGLAGPVDYLEIEAGHELSDPEQAHWPVVETAVRSFASRFM